MRYSGGWAINRWPFFDQRLHVAEKKGQQQGADVAAVHVGVGHQHRLAIAQAVDGKVVAHAGAQGRNHGLDLVVAQDLVEPGALGVEDLAAQRQDGLEVPVAALFGRAAGAVALDDVQLAFGRVALGAVGQLAGQGEAFQRRLADDQVAGLLGGVAGAGRGEALLDDGLGLARVFFQEVRQRPRPAPAGRRSGLPGSSA